MLIWLLYLIVLYPVVVFFKSLRQERSVKPENDETIQEFENASIQWSRSLHSAALGNYTIWQNEYRRVKKFEDILSLMQN